MAWPGRGHMLTKSITGNQARFVSALTRTLTTFRSRVFRLRYVVQLAAPILVPFGCRMSTEPTAAAALIVDPTELFMVVGSNGPIRVFVMRTDGTRVLVPARSARFTSSNPSVARLASDSAGLVLADAMGESRVAVALDVGSRVLRATVRVVVGRSVGGDR